jgi:proteasome lid subunit RPN8/RPN11
MGRKRQYYKYEYPTLWTPADMKALDSPEEYTKKFKDAVSDKWDTGTKVADKQATECSFCKKTEKATIKIHWDVYTVIKQLCVHIEDEWQLLLIGEADGPVVEVTDYIIPKQEVSGAYVKNLDCIDKKFVEDNKIVATIHSHSDMSVFFSCTDEETNMSPNIKYHIVYNNKGDYKACQQMVLPCGLIQLKDAEVELMLKEENIKGFDNIQKTRYRQTFTHVA